MNLLDLLIIAMLVASAAAGYTLGFVARLMSWAGLVAGSLVALFVVTRLAEAMRSQSATVLLLLSLLVLLLGGSIGSAIGETIGRHLRHGVPHGTARSIDRAGGALAGGVGVLVALWLIVPLLFTFPGVIAEQARGSTIASAVSDIAPPPPGPSQTLRALIDKADFPEVFEDFRAAPDVGPPPSAIPVPSAVVQRAIRSTVNVESRGCGRGLEGSGFAIAEDTIMTNAHVVAGATRTEVKRPDGRKLPGTVIGFDGDRDLAIIRVPNLGQTPLTVRSARPGDEGAFLGHPRGQDQVRVAPALVARQETAIGRDIHGQDRVRRQILVVAASLQSGDSGGPLIDTEGRVIGVAFAIAPDKPGTAYALPDEEINGFLADPTRESNRTCVE